MRLAILGGGGFRVPLVLGALLADPAHRIDGVSLHDVSPDRLRAITMVAQQMWLGQDDPPVIDVTDDLDTALRGADFVFSAIRVGGLTGRTTDERVALDLGLLGQETTGPGGIAYGLRTVPVALHVAERVAAVCPGAWIINFTNPAGMVTEAMQQVLGERVVGICDSPVGLGRRAARAMGLEPGRTRPDYVGLNHLGWLRGLMHDGRDVMPDLLADTAALQGFEEGRLFGADWIQTLGCLPNEYLYYYYFLRDAVAAIRGGGQTRGEFLLHQQRAFYEHVTGSPQDALSQWRRVREERDATYMRESRGEDEERDAADVAGGGYEGVALALMAAIADDVPATMILNVRNGSAVPGLPADAVVEVPCAVGASGPRPLATAPLRLDQLGLVQQVKAVEQLTVRAAVERSPTTAVAAFATHPLVDSVTTARTLLDGYLAATPELRSVLGARD